MECCSCSITILNERSQTSHPQWCYRKNYAAFFCSNSAHQLRNISEEVQFSHSMTTLNGTFERELTQEDKGYESGSESFSILTPLWRASRIYYVSKSENISFISTTPPTTAAQHPDHILEATALYTTVWHLTMMKALQQIAANSMEEQNNLHMYSNTWSTTAQMIPSRMPPKKKKKTSQQPY